LKKQDSISKKIENKIEKSCQPLIEKLEKQTNEIKKIEIQYKIIEKSLFIFLTEIKQLSESQWEKFAEERFEPLIEQARSISERFDTIMLRSAKDAKEYAKYQKSKKIHQKGVQRIFDIIDTIELNKRQLERLIALLFSGNIYTQNLIEQNNLEYYEFNQAGIIVKRRFGFDYNWLVCLSLIQLHENLIKKKITDLGGEIEKDEPIRSLISKLSKLIKDKEKREVSLALLLSNGIKETRDTMSHEGYKHNVTKQDLERIFREISELEHTLYPETKMN